MKKLLVLSCVSLLTNLAVFAQTNYGGDEGHLPFDHSHSPSCSESGGVCYGYAMGKAFNKENSDATCSPVDTYADRINTTYFQFYSGSSLSELREGDIISFGSGIGLGGHAAFVIDIPGDDDEEEEEPTPMAKWVAPIESGYSDGDVIVDQVPNEGGSPETKTLSQVKAVQGNPTGYFRLKEAYKISSTFKNSFNAGDVRVGKDKFGEWKELASGTPTSFFPNSNVEIMAIDGDTSGGFVQRYTDWSHDSEGPLGATNPTEVTVSVAGGIYTANFKKEFNITFQNSLPGGSGGQIQVAGTNRNSPYNTTVVEPNSISAAGLFQVIDRIEYTFSSWSSGSSPFTPTNHSTYTANYTAKPQWPANVSAGGTVGNPIQVTWTEHPNTNVTQYKIWRKVKPLGGQEGAAELIATVNRGTTGYFDSDYLVTSSYTDYKLTYDVRSYFSVNGTASDPNWSYTQFGESGANKMAETPQAVTMNAAEIPTEFAISSYPNPFNPSTTLRYSLAEDAEVTLAVYDMMGREVAVLVRSQQSAGFHSAQWYGKDAGNAQVATGVYMYWLVAAPNNGSQPIVLSGKLLLAK